MSDEWQPIETAPKDGTAILLTDARVLGWTHVAGWDEYQFRGETRWGWGRDDCTTYWHHDMFTHWMPIPQGPRSVTQVVPEAQKTL